MEPAHDPMTAVFSLTIYGPLGILALLAICVAVKLYFDGRRDRTIHAGQLKEEREACEKERMEHQTQMRLLEERYIVKAENNMEKYHALAESMNRVLDSATRRYPRNTSGSQSHGRSEDPNS